MKNIFVIFFLLPIVALPQGSEQIRNRKIKEIVTIEFHQENEDENRKVHDLYDKKGRLIERKVYRSNGELRFHKKIQYLDRNGSNEEIIFDLPSGKVKSITIRHFNKWENEVKMEKRDGQGRVDQSKVWEYDKKGRLMRLVTYGQNGLVISTRSLVYDKKGMILSDSTVDPQGKVIEQTTLQYTY